MIPRSVMILLLLVVALLSLAVEGFTTSLPKTTAMAHSMTTPAEALSTTALAERKWNFNEGGGPWGLKKNAEIWNGRVAQMAFVFVVVQELVQGKGVIQGVQEGDPLNLACLGAFAVSVIGLTAWLAIKGDDDYVNKELKK